jgi:hypothetical protein
VSPSAKTALLAGVILSVMLAGFAWLFFMGQLAP